MHRDASTHAGYDRATIAALLGALRARLRPRRATLVGLSGVQGSGKSTLARQLAVAANVRGIETEVLALDDFYLGRIARAALARTMHPLLATRGVPGTHDLALLARTLDALLRTTSRNSVPIPRFDKGRDTRVPPSRWRRVAIAPRLILLEGWCVGVPAQDPRALARPANALERNEDADRRWRSWVNTQLAQNYAALWRRLDALIVLAAPHFDIVEDWRGQPERLLRSRGAARALSPAQLRRFVMHYERISRHALRVLPGIADIVVTIDEERRVTRIRDAISAPARRRRPFHTRAPR
jgi:D-glycerate 3-kinase